MSDIWKFPHCSGAELFARYRSDFLSDHFAECMELVACMDRNRDSHDRMANAMEWQSVFSLIRSRLEVVGQNRKSMAEMASNGCVWIGLPMDKIN